MACPPAACGLCPVPCSCLQVRNEKARRFLASMRKKPGVDLAAYFPRADAGALALLRRLLAFDPADRPSAEEALADPYFHNLHSPAREPSAQVRSIWLQPLSLGRGAWQQLVVCARARADQQAGSALSSEVPAQQRRRILGQAGRAKLELDVRGTRSAAASPHCALTGVVAPRVSVACVCAQAISKLAFDFERRKLAIEEVRELIYREILEYHPQVSYLLSCGLVPLLSSWPVQRPVQRRVESRRRVECQLLPWASSPPRRCISSAQTEQHTSLAREGVGLRRMYTR